MTIVLLRAILRTMEIENVKLTSGKGIGLTLGSLEKKVFKSCLELGKATVREILKNIPEDYAYTTIMTICDRLSKKGVFTREKSGRCYVYAPANTKEELDNQAMHKVLGKIADSMTEPVIEGFLDILEKRDIEKLEILEKMIADRKQKRNSKEK